MSVATLKSFARYFIESNMDSPESTELAAGKVAAFCRRCPGKVEPNDDSAAVVQLASGAVVLAVADGVGGCPAGYKASAIAIESVVDSVLENAVNVESYGDLRPSILDGIELANQQILDLGIGAATTLAVVEIQDGKARGYQVGDSMSLVIGGRGAIKWKSTPHSPVGYGIEAGMLDEADAMHHDERHVVSNLVGYRSMHIEIGPSQPLSVRDTVIIASDGLSDNLHLEEVIEYGRSGRLEKRIQTLAELASKRMTRRDSSHPSKPDDFTILAFTS